MVASPSNFDSLLEMLRRTRRWRPAVAKTADHFVELSIPEYENLIQSLVESGEDEPLGILMCVCGVNNVRLNPHVLTGALKVAEPPPILPSMIIPYGTVPNQLKPCHGFFAFKSVGSIACSSPGSRKSGWRFLI